MARTTRSSTQHEKKEDDKDKIHDALPLSGDKTKPSSRKRKRTTAADSDLHPSKQSRSDTEHTPTKDEQTQQAERPSYVGDLSLKEEDAQKILDILEMIDKQGLLDRVFPLDDVLGPTLISSPSSSKTPSDSYSLRTLLKEASDHPLRVYRSAIKQLFPISSQPRVRISPPAAQQLRFCRLALALIDQASQHILDASLLQPEQILAYDDESLSTQDDSSAKSKRRKYALVQRLPGGDWWTSLDSDLPGTDIKPLKTLGTAYADLVSILPTPSISLDPPPTLGDLYAGKKPIPKAKLPGPRRVSCGSFLDYGAYSSFAPTFDCDGADIGRVGVSSFLWHRYQKGKAREKARILRERISRKPAQGSLNMDVDQSMLETTGDETELQRSDKEKELLRSFLSEEETTVVMKALNALELEEGVTDLLRRNARALVRLEELQKQRLASDSAEVSYAKVESEEWELAQKIMDSLMLLASLRPRMSMESGSAVIPPAPVLRALHQILPADPVQGWHGTLAESKGTALRDDTTVYLKATVTSKTPVPTSTVASSAPTPAPAPSYPTGSTHPQQGYAYSNYSQYRNAFPTSGFYSTPGYAPVAGTPHGQSATTPAQSTYASHSVHYNSAGQYPFSSWFTGYHGGTGTPGAGSDRGTPQPVTSAGITPAVAAYTAFGSAATSATPVRAVANTVTNKAQTNGWTTPGVATGYVAPTLPPHLRQAVGITNSPGTPGVSVQGYVQNYLAGYQQTPPATS